MKKLVTCLLFLFALVEVPAQTFEKFFSLSYDVGVPLSNKEIVDGTSTKGFKIGYRQVINERFIMGADFTNGTYKGYSPRQTYTTATGALTTDFYRYAYVYGLTLGGDYLFSPEKKLQPFAGFGVGASYVSYNVFYNVFSNSDPKWGLLLRPQAGVFYTLGKYSSWGVQAGVHYDFSTAKSEDFGNKNFSNVGFHIGLVFFDW